MTREILNKIENLCKERIESKWNHEFNRGEKGMAKEVLALIESEGGKTATSFKGIKCTKCGSVEHTFDQCKESSKSNWAGMEETKKLKAWLESQKKRLIFEKNMFAEVITRLRLSRHKKGGKKKKTELGLGKRTRVLIAKIELLDKIINGLEEPSEPKDNTTDATEFSKECGQISGTVLNKKEPDNSETERTCNDCKFVKEDENDHPCVHCTENVWVKSYFEPRKKEPEKTCENCKHTNKRYEEEPCDNCEDKNKWEAEESIIERDLTLQEISGKPEKTCVDLKCPECGEKCEW